MKLERTDVWYLLVIAAAASLLTLKGISQGDFWHSDSARHALNGVFIHDLLAKPTLQVVSFAREYYRQYPALSLVYHPPLFPLVESVFFSLFGISVTSARLAVYLYVWGAIIGWYALVKTIYDRQTALFASLVLFTTPYVVLLSRSVLLELPVLAMGFPAGLFFYRFVEEGRNHWFGLSIFFLILALYTKQTSVFLIIPFMAYALMNGKGRPLLTLGNSIATFIFILGLVLLLLLSYKYSPIGLAQSIGRVGPFSRLTLGNWTYYIKMMPQQLSWPVLTSGILFGIWTVVKAVRPLRQGIPVKVIIARHRSLVFTGLWLGACYLFFSLLSVKYPRHTVYWIPIWCLWSVLFFLKIKVKNIPVGIYCLAVLCLFQAVWSFKQDKPLVKGHEEMVRYILNQETGIKNILFSGYFNGNFIFFMRKHDAEKRVSVLRASRELAEIPIMVEYGVRELVGSPEEILDYLRANRITHIVLEEHHLLALRVHTWLKELMQRGAFKEVHSVPLESSLTDHKNNRVILYRYAGNDTI